MAGNVREWVSDWYASDYYSYSPDANPQGPPVGIDKVVRGGTWGSDWADIRVADRWNVLPTNDNHSIGFRCAWPPG
jgi:formylglycine-generating enzyme required for sulfatase activity